MRFVLLPGDIADVGITNDTLALHARKQLNMHLAISCLECSSATEGIGSSIARIVEDAQHIMMLEVAPDKIALVRACPYVVRKRYLLLMEHPHRRECRSRLMKRAKEQADSVLDLAVGVQDDAFILGIAEADRQVELEGGAAGFAENTALQACPQDIQFCLTHRTFQSEQKPIVERCRVIQSILVENKRTGERANFEQVMPIARAARQARDFQAEHQSD